MQYTIAPVFFFAAFTATAGAAAHVYLNGTDGQITGKVATALGVDGQPISGAGNVDDGADDVGLELGDLIYGVSFDGISFDSFVDGLPALGEMASDPNSPFGTLLPDGRRKGPRKGREFGTRGPPGGGGCSPGAAKRPGSTDEPDGGSCPPPKKSRKEQNEEAARKAADEICKTYTAYKKKKLRTLADVNKEITSQLHPLLSSPWAPPGGSDRCQQSNTTATVVGNERNGPFIVGTNSTGLNGRQSEAIRMAKKQCGIEIEAVPGLTPSDRNMTLACRASSSDCPHTPFQGDDKADTNKHHAEMRAIYAFCKANKDNDKIKDKPLCEAIGTISCDKPACGKCAAVLQAWGVSQSQYEVTREASCVFHKVESPLTPQALTVAQCAAVQAEDDGGGKPPATGN